MGTMSLGNTLEEKKTAYQALTTRSKKWGKVFGVLGMLSFLSIGVFFTSGMESLVLGLLLTLLLAAIVGLGYYGYGQILYYGYLFVRSFLAQRNIGADDVAIAAGTSFLVSYVVGGKKSVKTLGIIWLIIIGLVITIGIFAGLYYYIKFRKEAKELGFI